MAINKVQNGDIVTIEKAGVSSGDAVSVGALTGVALTDSNLSNLVEIATNGVYDLPVLANDGYEDIVLSKGALIFISDEGVLSADDSGVLFGVALDGISVAGTTAEIEVFLGGLHMATNKVQDGKVLTITKASVDSGDVVVVGAITGVALTDTDANGKIELAREGVYALTVTGNDGTDDATVAIGDKIYASAAGALSLDSSGTYFGIALEAISVAGAAAEIDVLLV